MRTPDYNELKNLEKLAFTIKCILDYGGEHFKAINLVKASIVEDGHYFSPHLRHLTKKHFLTTERLGKSKNRPFKYTVQDREGLHNYLRKLSILFYQKILEGADK